MRYMLRISVCTVCRCWFLKLIIHISVILIFSGYFGDNILLHFFASMISGLATTAASMPVDIAKTR